MNLGTILSSLCWDGVDILEKEARSINSYIKNNIPNVNIENISLSSINRISSYSTPIQVIYLLLNRPFNTPQNNQIRYCHRRSGRYYERLCIDLEQIGMWKNALYECRQALQDKYVQVNFNISTILYSSYKLNKFILGIIYYWIKKEIFSTITKI